MSPNWILTTLAQIHECRGAVDPVVAQHKGGGGVHT